MKRFFRPAVLCLLVCGTVLMPAISHAEISAALRIEIDKTVDAAKSLRETALAAGLQDFYRARNHLPVWTTERGLTERGQAALSLSSLAVPEGLEPGDYALADEIRAMPATADVTIRARREIAVADLIMKYASDVGDGRAYVREFKPDLFVFKESVKLGAVLRSAATAEDMIAYFATLAPAAQAYRDLCDQLAVYRQIAATGGWPRFQGQSVLKPGASSTELAALRGILLKTGDIASDSQVPLSATGVYGGGLVEGVKAFQKRHGLTPDGIIGAKTRSALNVPVGQRIRQILVNMERLRWTPDMLGDPHVEVNLAGFELTAVRGGKVMLRMPVIVGKAYRESPVFSDRISYLVLNPDWTVPRVIATQDILPKILHSSSYLSDNGFQVFAANGTKVAPETIDWSRLGVKNFPYRLVQAPGSRNALGTIKFMFPNRFSVYLHDTPSRELFAKDVRTLSSGCIRVARPVELAEFVLNSDDWNADAVRRGIEAGKTRNVRVAAPVAVHLSYRTAWVDSDGAVQFRDDIYGRDGKLAVALFSSGK
jgi:L,D-transpeptidase YcbB